MIRQLSQEIVEEYATDATAKEQPAGTDYTQGVIVSKTIPAKWWNWLFGAVTKRLRQARNDTDNMLAELKNVVTDAGISLNPGNNSQLVEAVKVKTDGAVAEYIANRNGLNSDAVPKEYYAQLAAVAGKVWQNSNLTDIVVNRESIIFAGGKIFVCDAQYGDIYVSSDYGKTWQALAISAHNANPASMLLSTDGYIYIALNGRMYQLAVGTLEITDLNQTTTTDDKIIGTDKVFKYITANSCTYTDDHGLQKIYTAYGEQDLKFIGMIGAVTTSGRTIAFTSVHTAPYWNYRTKVIWTNVPWTSYASQYWVSSPIVSRGNAVCLAEPLKLTSDITRFFFSAYDYSGSDYNVHPIKSYWSLSSGSLPFTDNGATGIYNINASTSDSIGLLCYDNTIDNIDPDVFDDQNLTLAETSPGIVWKAYSYTYLSTTTYNLTEVIAESGRYKAVAIYASGQQSNVACFGLNYIDKYYYRMPSAARPAATKGVILVKDISNVPVGPDYSVIPGTEDLSFVDAYADSIYNSPDAYYYSIVTALTDTGDLYRFTFTTGGKLESMVKLNYLDKLPEGCLLYTGVHSSEMVVAAESRLQYSIPSSIPGNTLVFKDIYPLVGNKEAITTDSYYCGTAVTTLPYYGEGAQVGIQHTRRFGNAYIATIKPVSYIKRADSNTKWDHQDNATFNSYMVLNDITYIDLTPSSSSNKAYIGKIVPGSGSTSSDRSDRADITVYEGDDTNGTTRNICRFLDKTLVIVCSSAYGSDYAYGFISSSEDMTEWERVTGLGYGVNALTVFNDILYVNTQDGLYTTSDLTVFNKVSGPDNIVKLLVSNDRLYAFTKDHKAYVTDDGANWNLTDLTTVTDPAEIVELVDFAGFTVLLEESFRSPYNVKYTYNGTEWKTVTVPAEYGYATSAMVDEARLVLGTSKVNPETRCGAVYIEVAEGLAHVTGHKLVVGGL